MTNVDKRKLMASWKRKWDDDRIKGMIEKETGFTKKVDQIKYFTGEFGGLSKNQALQKMKSLKLSPKQRDEFIANNQELSKVFGKKIDPSLLSPRERRKLAKKAEMHKKFMVRRSKEATVEDRKAARRNRVANAYDNHGSAKEYGYANVEDEGHHKATALGSRADAATSITKGGDGSVVGDSGANSLTGGVKRGIAKGGRPMGL